MNSNNIEEILKDIFGMSLLDAKKMTYQIIIFIIHYLLG